jgi:hypothetical protein
MTLLGNRSDRLTKPLFHILEVARLIRYAGKSTSLSVDGGVVVGEGIFRFLIRQSVTSSFKLSVAVRTFSAPVQGWSRGSSRTGSIEETSSQICGQTETRTGGEVRVSTPLITTRSDWPLKRGHPWKFSGPPKLEATSPKWPIRPGGD